MSQLSLINAFLFFLTTLGGVFLAFWVYFSDRRNRINQFFFLLTIAMLLYLTFGYLSNVSRDFQQVLFWKRLFLSAVSLFIIFSYFFSIYFPEKRKRYPILDTIVVITEIIFIYLLLTTNLIIKGVEFQRWGTNITFGNWKNIFFATMVIFSLLLVGQIFKKYFRISKEKKLQVQYFLVGVFVFAALNIIFNMVFPVWKNTYEYYYIGDSSAVFLFGLTAYAIVKHELFGIKVVLTALLVAVMAIILAIQIFTAQSVGWRLLNGAIFILFCLFGYYLVKAVQGEERRRKEAEMMVVREVALRRKAEKLAQEFKKLDENKTQFMLATQHHLRTPLTAIQGYLSMLYEGSWGKLTPAIKPKVKGAFDSTRKLIRLVNEFLDIAQFEVGKEVIIKREIQAEKIVQEVVQDLKQEAKRKELYLKLEKPKPLPKIMADPEKIKEALYNIVYNGIKYTERGGVNIKLQSENGKFNIVVSDTGIGMERDEILALFQKSFARGEEAKKMYTTGRGIGLYLAYQIIKAHGGRVWAESAGKGKGSTFYIELPVK